MGITYSSDQVRIITRIMRLLFVRHSEVVAFSGRAETAENLYTEYVTYYEKLYGEIAKEAFVECLETMSRYAGIDKHVSFDSDMVEIFPSKYGYSIARNDIILLLQTFDNNGDIKC